RDNNHVFLELFALKMIHLLSSHSFLLHFTINQVLWGTLQQNRGGCTDFVWQYFAAKGIYIANIVNGNGGYWGTNGVSQGVLRRTNLAPGVIASGFTDHFTGYGTSTTARTSPYGHVAVVTGVNPDGTFNVQEAGYGGTFPWGNVRTNISPENVVFLLPN
ncbi:CHAP domain-containing protein, partial [Streptococcus hyovaginalis]